MIGKKVAIFYDDSTGKVNRKEGILTSISDTEYTLDNKIIIPKSRVVRVEVQE